MKRFTPTGALAILLVIIFFALILQSSFTGRVFYRDAVPGYGYGFVDFLPYSLIDFYYSYALFVDAIIFLLVFLGIGKTMFKKHFGEGGSAVSVGIGLFLAFALVLWEERTGVHLLTDFGQFAVLFIFLILLVGIYVWFRNAGASGFWSALLLILGLLIILFFMKYNDLAVYQIFMDFFCSLAPPVCEAVDSLLEKMKEGEFWMVVSGIGLFLAGICRFVFKRKKKNP